MNPLVTVNILSYNRIEELRNTLTKVFDQDYKNIEVIVVDNASADGSPEMVEKEFPNVKLIKLEKNIGIAGWNRGFEIAKGEFVLVLDDDAYPDITSLNLGVSYLKSNCSYGIVAYRIENKRYHLSETANFFDPPKMFVGCGALISNSVINSIGYFNERIFIYYHELDYSARCYNAGYKIKYLDKAKIYHLQSSSGRNDYSINPFISSFRFYNYFISFSIFLFSYFHYRHAIKYFGKWIVNRLIICFRYSYYKSFIKALVYIFANIRGIVSERKVLDKNVQQFYNNGNHALVDRLYFPTFRNVFNKT
ncbi:MAG: glycosyltransferase family 2 protein [Melioribacteraceae bacterium]|nr:glycosyltransferase family 2 protein [Melioribacteraceae bacterium]MCF8355516.1 glycosyltransferase family 2 protein [Melioribacteraceae bacterium]MCF8394204.1 glycosyltransferase family 2 protein [Melioribacteraceae bacterium]MCF8419924.1 glycosyltransferase family 2 protein [Melioribacteraceae bacterium]